MAQGPLDHPSYLTRQTILLGKTTAGASTIQYTGTHGGSLVFPFDIRVRNVVASVDVTGTASAVNSGLILYAPGTSVQFPAAVLTNNIGTNVAVNGSAATALTTNTSTTTLGFVTAGTSTASSVVQSGDMNFRIPAGQQLIIKNGTDSQFVMGSVAIEYYIDPVTAAWTGNN